MTKLLVLLIMTALSSVVVLAEHGPSNPGQTTRPPAERQVYGHYLLIHAALARDALGGVREAATTIAELARNEPKLPASVAEQAEKVAQAKDLPAARDAFRSLSDTLISHRVTSKDLVDQFYVVRCPMANNNEGASWLQGTRIVRNPYFGESMLKCGKVISP